jgi:hypothetical protein
MLAMDGTSFTGGCHANSTVGFDVAAYETVVQHSFCNLLDH